MKPDRGHSGNHPRDSQFCNNDSEVVPIWSSTVHFIWSLGLINFIIGKEIEAREPEGSAYI